MVKEAVECLLSDLLCFYPSSGVGSVFSNASTAMLMLDVALYNI